MFSSRARIAHGLRVGLAMALVCLSGCSAGVDQELNQALRSLDERKYDEAIDRLEAIQTAGLTPDNAVMRGDLLSSAYIGRAGFDLLDLARSLLVQEERVTALSESGIYTFPKFREALSILLPVRPSSDRRTSLLKSAELSLGFFGPSGEMPYGFQSRLGVKFIYNYTLLGLVESQEEFIPATSALLEGGISSPTLCESWNRSSASLTRISAYSVRADLIGDLFGSGRPDRVASALRILHFIASPATQALNPELPCSDLTESMLSDLSDRFAQYSR